MPYGEYAKCPKCGKVAFGEGDIEDKLGYREMGTGKIIPQSWCRDCRLGALRNTAEKESNK